MRAVRNGSSRAHHDLSAVAHAVGAKSLDRAGKRQPPGLFAAHSEQTGETITVPPASSANGFATTMTGGKSSVNSCSQVRHNIEGPSAYNTAHNVGNETKGFVSFGRRAATHEVKHRRRRDESHFVDGRGASFAHGPVLVSGYSRSAARIGSCRSASSFVIAERQAACHA